MRAGRRKGEKEAVFFQELNAFEKEKELNASESEFCVRSHTTHLMEQCVKQLPYQGVSPLSIRHHFALQIPYFSNPNVAC